jgi:hypothetical protein
MIRTRIAVGAITLLALAGCGDEPTPDDQQISTATEEVSLPADCESVPTGDPGLTRVTVEPAVGHPPGAQSITWQTNSPIPDRGVAAFTWTSGNVLRGLKYLDGEIIANYVSYIDYSGRPQRNIEIPPATNENSYTVFVPAADAADLGTSWVADLEVDEMQSASSRPESTGQCVPS